MKVKFIDELDQIICKYELNYEDICIVASAVLAYEDVRENHDLDISMKPIARTKFIERYRDELEILPSGTVNIINGIQLLCNRYVKIGISDEELFCEKYINKRGNHLVVRPELELAQKIKRGQEKDLRDLRRIEYRFYETPKFDMNLFKKLIYKIDTIERNIINIKKNENERQAISLVEGEYVLPIGALLHKGYSSEGYNRYDILVSCYFIANKHKVTEMNNICYQLLDKTKLLMIEELEEGASTFQEVNIDENGNLEHEPIGLIQAINNHDTYAKVGIKKDINKLTYSLEWIKKYNIEFTLEIEKYKNNLFKEYGVYFCAIVWGAVKNFVEEIKDKIESKFHIVERKYVVFKKENYSSFIKDIYSIDAVDKWKTAIKIELLKGYDNSVDVFIFEIPFPNFREKIRDGSYLSDESAKLKRDIRGEFKDNIQDYEKDIIIHIGDNHRHNSKMIKIIEKYERKMENETGI